MTFFDPAGSSAPIDLQVPETFHRLKRTLLLLCSVLIVLGLAQGAQTRELKLTMVDVSLHIEIIRSLLWLAALYYLAGFAMEVRIVRLINSEAMLGAGMKTVEGAFGKIGRSIKESERRVDDAVAEVSGTLNDILQTTFISVDPTTILNQMTKLGIPTSDPAIMTRLTAMDAALSQAMAEQGESHRAVLLKTDRMANAVQAYQIRRSEFEDLLNRLEKDLGKLSRRVHGDRRLSFWVWEIGGAAGAFSIATLINGGHLLRNLADFCISLLRVFTAAV